MPKKKRLNPIHCPRDVLPITTPLTDEPCAVTSSSMTTARAVRALKAIAQETRLNIIEILMQQKTCGLPAGVIAASLDISPNLMSFHLKELSNAEILVKKTAGRNILYSINTEFTHSFFEHLRKYQWPQKN